MNSRQNRSEVVVGRWPCEQLAGHPAPFVLVGGLGMGCTLRAALDVLPTSARVLVAELNPVIERWCRGPLAGVHGHALDDPRVQVEIADVCDVIEAHGRKGAPRFDAIVLDLYEGPHAKTDANRDPLYGRRALERTRQALHPGGYFAVWSEAADAGFERRLAAARFETQRARPGQGRAAPCSPSRPPRLRHRVRPSRPTGLTHRDRSTRPMGVTQRDRSTRPMGLTHRVFHSPDGAETGDEDRVRA